MTRSALSSCKELCSSFEGKKAIYLEKAVYYVRVTNIAYHMNRRVISARVESISVPGLEDTPAAVRNAYHRPTRWQISAGYLTVFSRNTWYMGYGGWSLYFDPIVVRSVLQRAAQWESWLSVGEKYQETLRYLDDLGAREPTRRIFPD